MAALAGLDGGNARNALDALIGAHLLEQVAQDRYQFHDLLRSYAMDQLRGEESPENRTAVLRRVLSWYLYTADAAQSHLNPMEKRVVPPPLDGDVRPLALSSYSEAVRWYESERANLVAATRLAAEADLPELTLPLARVFRSISTGSNPFEDRIVTSELGLAAARLLEDRAGEADMLEGLGMAHTQAHDLRRGEEFHRAALEVRRELGDRVGEGLSLNDIGVVCFWGRRLEQALERLIAERKKQP